MTQVRMHVHDVYDKRMKLAFLGFFSEDSADRLNHVGFRRRQDNRIEFRDVHTFARGLEILRISLF